MTKKGYQKRLPSVLPGTLPPALPRPRTAPAPDESPPSARPPGPRAAVPPAARRPSHEPVTAPEPFRRVEPAPVAAQAPATLRPAGAAAALAPARSDSDTIVRRAVGALVVVTLLAGLGLGVLLLTKDSDAPPTARAPTSTAAPPPVPLSADESYVETRVRANGDVVVRQWIRAAKPLRWLDLALPDVPGASGLSASRVQVLADGAVVAGTDRITDDRRGSYLFARTTDLEVRYVLRGAVERSDSAPGRALAVATSLDVLYDPLPQRETRVVHASAVLSLACTSSADAPIAPCGEAESADSWRVELAGARVADRVVAQVNLDGRGSG